MSPGFSISRIRDLINRERLYVLMLSFILLVNAAYILAQKVPAMKEGFVGKRIFGLRMAEEEKVEEIYESRASEEIAWEEALAKEGHLLGLLNMLGLAVLLVFSLGLFLDVRILTARFRKREIIKPIFRHPAIRWQMADIFRLAIIFVFLAFVINIIESQIFSNFSSKEKLKHLFSLVNTGIMDLMLLGFIIYFVRVKYGQHLSAIGLKIKKVGKLIVLAILSYTAFLPILSFLLLLLVILAGLFNYQPPQQELFKIFLEEKSLAFLIYSTAMVVILGPIVEELFFRGFAYNAIKKRWGAKKAMALTAVVFAGLHGTLFGFLPIMALGFLLAYMYEKSGSLIPSIVIHILHNSLMVFLLFMGRYFVREVSIACFYH